MAAFQKEYGDQFGLTARPGTPAFDAQWQRAAKEDPDGLVKAENAFHQQHIVAPMQQQLSRLGIPDEIVKDPRVQAYMADRSVQQGPNSTLNHGQRILDAASNSNNADEFLQNLSAADKEHLPGDFKTYLSEHPGNFRGLVNRIDSRLQNSLGLDVSGVTAPFAAVGNAAEEGIGALAKGAQRIVSKGFDNSGNQQQHPFQSQQDQASGGLLHRLFGVNFNPLNLSSNERMAMFKAGATMMATGNTGEGLLAGANALQQGPLADRQAQMDALKLEELRQKIAEPRVMNETEDNWGTKSKQYGAWDKASGTYKPITPGPAQAGQPSQPPADEIGAPPKWAEPIVDSMIEGKMQPPSSFALTKPYWQKMMAWARAKDPDFDEATWAQRRKTATDFAPGSRDGQQITYANTSLQHLGQLWDISKSGGLGDTRIPAVNAVENWYGRNLAPESSPSKTAQTNWNAVRNTYAADLERLFAQGVGSEGEKERMLSELDAAASPKQREEVMKSQAKLLQARVGTLEQQRNEIMGGKSKVAQTPLLQRESSEVLGKMGVTNSTMSGRGAASRTQATTSQAQAAPTTPPRPANVPAGAGYSPSTGKWYDPVTHQPIQ